MTQMSFCVREGKQIPPRKQTYTASLMAISEREESDCREGTEPDGAECSTNSPNSAADSMEVHRIIISET